MKTAPTPPKVVASGNMTISQYRSVHLWVEYHIGKPKECSHCGTTNTTVVYEWANISGEYKRKPDDWVRLCRSCHRAYDAPTHCKRGHERTPDNIYRNPSGDNICRICKQDYQKAYSKRRKGEL